MKWSSAALSTVLVLGACGGEQGDPTGPGVPADGPQTLPALVEQLPGSRNHSPDGTWWGHNMREVVRRGNFVFTYVIENDDDPTTPSTFRVYKKGRRRKLDCGRGI